MKEFRKLKSLKFLYEINEDGILRNAKSKRIINGYTEKNGYQRVRIENKCLGGIVRTTIHQLVAEAFVPNPNPDKFKEVNHLDANKQNNSVSNLEWTDHSGNMKHAYSLGINTKPLVEYRESKKRKISNGKDTFESISDAGQWLAENGRCLNQKSGIAGISAVLHKRRKNFGGYEWNFV